MARRRHGRAGLRPRRGRSAGVRGPDRAQPVDVDEFNRWDARGVVYMIDMGRFLRLPKSENPA